MKKVMGRPINKELAKKAHNIAKKHPTLKGPTIAKIMSQQLGRTINHKSVYRWLTYDVS